MFSKVESVGIFMPFVLVTAVWLAVLCPVVNGQAVSPGPVKMAEMAWVKHGDGDNTILYSFLTGDEWSAPIQLSKDNRKNLVPTLTADNLGKTFIAWSVINGPDTFLYYVILNGTSVETGPVRIETGMITNMAPFLAVDHDGIPWLVWAGNNGSTSDIFFSSWLDSGWQRPKRVHDANNVPDTLPELIVDPGGSVRVKWSTYGSDGATTVSRVLKGGNDVSPTSDSLSFKPTGGGATDPLACIATLPAENIDLDKASLLSRCQDKMLPTQMQFIGKAIRKKRQTLDSW